MTLIGVIVGLAVDALMEHKLFVWIGAWVIACVIVGITIGNIALSYSAVWTTLIALGITVVGVIAPILIIAYLMAKADEAAHGDDDGYYVYVGSPGLT